MSEKAVELVGLNSTGNLASYRERQVENFEDGAIPELIKVDSGVRNIWVREREANFEKTNPQIKTQRVEANKWVKTGKEI